MLLRTTLVSIVVALVLASCSSAESGDPEPALVVDGEYLAVAASTFEIVDGSVVRLGIADGMLSLSAGCNTLGSSFRLDGNQLVLDDIASTMMGCAEELADQDARLAAFLGARPAVAASPDGFTLTSSDGRSLVFVDRVVADPDRALEGTRWVLDAVVDGAAAVGAVGFDTVVILLDGGTVYVITGCSQGQATYTLDGTEVVLGPLELTAPSGGDCSAGVLEAEEALASVFGGTATATVRADTLELQRNGIGLNFREG